MGRNAGPTADRREHFSCLLRALLNALGLVNQSNGGVLYSARRLELDANNTTLLGVVRRDLSIWSVNEVCFM